jgi:hypothetical protein
MRILHDYQGRAVRLTPERLAHIREHPEMRDMERAIEHTLARPQCVIASSTDHDARLYYRYYEHTPVDGKYLCVVLKLPRNDAFVLTAYLTDTVKQGVLVWQSAK